MIRKNPTRPSIEVERAAWPSRWQALIERVHRVHRASNQNDDFNRWLFITTPFVPKKTSVGSRWAFGSLNYCWIGDVPAFRKTRVSVLDTGFCVPQQYWLAIKWNHSVLKMDRLWLMHLQFNASCPHFSVGWNIQLCDCVSAEAEDSGSRWGHAGIFFLFFFFHQMLSIIFLQYTAVFTINWGHLAT